MNPKIWFKNRKTNLHIFCLYSSNFSFDETFLSKSSVKRKTTWNKALGKSTNHYASDVEFMEISEDI